MDKIVMLKGPDKVRKRVCVVFGAKGNEGATNAIKMLLDIFITEAKFGFSRGIDLKIHKDNSVSIRSYDDGFILDETIDEGKPIFEKVFCELYAEDRYIDDYYGFLGDKHNRLYGRNDTDLSFKTEKDHQHNLCCVQYASRFMRVEATRDGIKKIVEFKDGCLANEMRKENFQEESNTFIHFKLEDEVFEEKVAVFTKDIEDYLKYAAIAIPNLKCKIQDERCDNKVVFQYQNGAKDYVLEKIKSPFELFINESTATGKDRCDQVEYDAKAKILICFCDNSGDVLCLHNCKRLEYGGSHLNAIKEKIAPIISQEFKVELSFDDIKDKVFIVVETTCDENATKYENATKKSIRNKMITDMCSNLISNDFEFFLKQNHDKILALLKI